MKQDLCILNNPDDAPHETTMVAGKYTHLIPSLITQSIQRTTVHSQTVRMICTKDHLPIGQNKELYSPKILMLPMPFPCVLQLKILTETKSKIDFVNVY